MGVTQRNNACAQVFYGLELRQGDRILTSQQEYASNYTAFLQARRPAALLLRMGVRSEG